MTAPALRIAPPPVAKPRLKKMKIADLFCGAGGSSTGAQRALRALGMEMDLVAVNHWPTAVATHTLNHPNATHFCQDIATLRPIVAVPKRRLHLLMASPTCTYHSRARGGKPVSDQQRMDPWHVITWLTELRVDRLIVENVPEFVQWGPVDLKTERPIPSRRGEIFQTWVNAIKGLGFKVEWRILNAADYGDATTRKRFFLIARSDGKPIRWPQATHTKSVGLPGIGPTKKWRPAREIIDWDQHGKSIFNRKKPLSQKTLARILAGAIKFKWPDPFIWRLQEHIYETSFTVPATPTTVAETEVPLISIHSMGATPGANYPDDVLDDEEDQFAIVEPVAPGPFVTVLRQHMDGQSVEQPLPTVTAGGTHIGIAQAFVQMNRTGSEAKSPETDPVPTITGSAGGGIGLVEPFVVRSDMHKSNAGCVYPAEDPLHTITTTGGHAVVEGFVLPHHRGGSQPQPLDNPVPTITTGEPGYLVEPFIAACASERGRARSVEEPIGTQHASGNAFAVVEPFVLSPGSGGSPRSVSEPVPTIVAGTNGIAHQLVEPFVLSQASGGAPRPTTEPLPTLTTDGAESLIAPYYGGGSGLTCTPATDPLPTVTTKARFGVVVPVTHTKGGNSTTSVEDPIPTVTTARGGEFAIAMPVTHHGGDRARSVDEPLPTITGAHRGEHALIAPAFGERPGQAPRVHSVDEPVPTIAAQGRIPLATAHVGQHGDLSAYDIRFRMLNEKELARATGFDDAESAYEFTGTKTEIIAQIGNAVPVNTAAALVRAVFE